MDADTRREVELFRTGQRPWLVVPSGMNLDALPETPTGFAPEPDPAWWPIAWFTVGLMSMVGASVVSYVCENDGAAFVNLVARPQSGPDARQAEKSTRPMRGHTDAVSFPFPGEFALGGEEHSPAPDLLVLVALRNPLSTPTRLASLSKALEGLTDEEAAALEGSHFDIKPQGTFATDKVRVGCPLVSRAEANGLAVRFSHSSVVPSHGAPDIAGQALGRLAEFLPDLYENMALKPGDVCLVHNRLVIHGRGAPGCDVGGRSRWLLRTYGWIHGTVGHAVPSGADHIHL